MKPLRSPRKEEQNEVPKDLQRELPVTIIEDTEKKEPGKEFRESGMQTSKPEMYPQTIIQAAEVPQKKITTTNSGENDRVPSRRSNKSDKFD